MSLGLETVRSRGRAGALLPTVLSARALSSEEVLRASTREAGTKAVPLVRVSERHRQLARLLAAGESPGAAAAKMGLSASRVSILLDDPTFKELLARYRQGKDDHLYGLFDRLQALGTESVEELLRRLEEDPESFTHDELALLTKLAADRTGHGPSKTETKNVNLNFGDLLEEARRRAAILPPSPGLANPQVVEDIEYEEAR